MGTLRQRWELWVAVGTFLLTLVASTTLLYARFYNLEWRVAQVEEKVDKLLDHFSILVKEDEHGGP
jgi:hypothetical protein